MIREGLLKPARAGSAASRRRWGALLAGALVGVAAVLGTGGTPAEAADLKGAFRGNAFGTYANVQAGDVAAELGRSAYQPCPCRGTDGEVLSNRINSLRAGQGGRVLTADVTLATVFTQKTSSTAKAQNTSTITGVDLFDGLITAQTIKAVANISANSSTISGTSNGSTFLNLKIAGRGISANVAPNTVIALPGLGKVTLNRVRRTGDFRAEGRILVEMLTVDITQQNTFGLKIGAKIIVAHALAGYRRMEPEAVVAGQAYATLANAKIGDVLENDIGKAAFVNIGCEGTDGDTETNNISRFDVGRVLSLGTAETTAFGGPRNGGTLARTTATVENVNLLGGLITAAVVKAVAQETFDDGDRTRSTAGSGFVALKIGALSLPLNPPPNTEVPLLGFGKIIINEQIAPSRGRLQVNGLHIFITRTNVLGLPVGAEIIIAHADASATRF